MKKLLFVSLFLSACATAQQQPAPRAATACLPKAMLTSYVAGQFDRPSSDCYAIRGGYACNLPYQFLPYALIELPKQVSSTTTVFGDVSACYLTGDTNECWRWFRARCTCGSGCTAEPLPENR